MLSKRCDIDEFVEAVKDKKTWDVLILALEEADQADRMIQRSRRGAEAAPCCDRQYARQLKQLINYFRYAVKPLRPQSKVYQLYQNHWGQAAQGASNPRLTASL
jgi:hypothetical protein